MSAKTDTGTATGHAARFETGDAVRIDDRAVLGHCRTPWFLRGKTGVIVEQLGAFKDPERLAYHRPGYPAQRLYAVRFRQTELWPDYAGPAHDHLDADIYESWLIPQERRSP
jgi:nitrile hydratase subunit beta